MQARNPVRWRRAAAVLIAATLAAGCDMAQTPAPVVRGQGSGTYAAPVNVPPPPPVGALGRPHPDQIVVQSGQTLYEVSRRYDLPIRAIIDANNLEPPYRLQAGRTLSLPQVRTHLVRAGDTLYGISRVYGVDTATLAQTNHLPPPYTIRTGTVLVLPPQTAPGVAAGEGAAPAPAGTGSGIVATPLAPPQASGPPGSTPAAAPLEPPQSPSSQPAPVQTLPPLQPVPVPDQTASLPPPRAGKNFLWPVRGKVIGRFGTNPNGTHNDGVNIAAAEGTPIVSADAGVVAYAGNELRGYGNLVLIKHADGWMTAYAHGSKLLVTRGERVQRGQAIARVGATGAVNEPQLHFEIRKGTRALDPLDYLPPSAVSAVGG